MSSLPLFTAVMVVVLAGLVWFFLRTRSNDQLDEILNRHKATSKITTKADFVEGMNHIPVALVLKESEIFYENPDLQARLEIARIDEVEYDSELATGNNIESGRVLRLRSHGHAFEFILDASSAEKWSTALPPHRMDEPGAVHAV